MVFDPLVDGLGGGGVYAVFGLDGGGEGFAFDLRVPERPVIAVPFIGMDLADATPVAETFDGFLEYLRQLN